MSHLSGITGGLFSGCDSELQILNVMLDITKPNLLLDKTICLKNIERMAARASSAGVSFRPHCKTHQSHEIANWFRDFGVSGITVSSFDMAEYFIQDGWKDVLVAFPFNPLEIRRLNEMASMASISVLADNAEVIRILKTVENQVGVYVDINTGYDRTGIRSDQKQPIESLINAIKGNPKLEFSGFYCHAGHSYKAVNRSEKEKIHQKAISDLSSLKQQFKGYSPRILYGDTPNCSIQENFEGIDEITPGNFVFYDLTQVAIGSCKESDIAVAMVCPVAGKYPEKGEILIHGGGVHFSKESLKVDNRVIFGKEVKLASTGWTSMQTGAYVTSLSQEHGLVSTIEGDFKNIKIGDLMTFLPVHSCLTANLMNGYTSLDGHNISTC